MRWGGGEGHGALTGITLTVGHGSVSVLQEELS